MAVHLDVTRAFGVGIRLHRHRQQGRTLNGVEQRPAGRAQMGYGAVIEVGDQLADRAVELRQGEELALSQPGQYPTLHDLDGHFDLCLVARPSHSGLSTAAP